MKTSKTGISLIVHFEGLNDWDLTKIGLQPKPDPSGYLTAGYGRVLRDLNGKYLVGADGYRRMMEIYPELDSMTIEDADEMLEEDLCRFESQIDSLKLKLTQFQYDAIVSLCYNIGFGNFLSSTLLRRIKGEKGSIREAFNMWNRSNGRVLRGLSLRRETEATLFLDGTLKF